jgi:hypothetical protein
MGLIILVLSIIVFLIFFLKIINPLLDKIAEAISNKLIKNFIYLIGIALLIYGQLSVILYIIKYYPKSNEQEKKIKYTKFKMKGFDAFQKTEYNKALTFYDSAEKYAEKKYEFHLEKSNAQYFLNNSDLAINLINRLIQENEENGKYSSYEYENRSMYYFSIKEYENAITDLKIAYNIDSSYAFDWKLQISMMYLLLNKSDSSLNYLIKAEETIFNENELEEHLKQLNLLKSLVYFKKGDKETSCLYFKQYEKATDVYMCSNYSADLSNSRFHTSENMYRSLFKNEFNLLIKLCN